MKLLRSLRRIYALYPFNDTARRPTPHDEEIVTLDGAFISTLDGSDLVTL